MTTSPGLSFRCFSSVSLHQLSYGVILAFLEFLTFNKVSDSGLLNHLSAIKTKLVNFGLNISCFNEQRIKVYNKAIIRHALLNPHIKVIIDIEMHNVIYKKDLYRIYIRKIFKVVFLTSLFFSL